MNGTRYGTAGLKLPTEEGISRFDRAGYASAKEGSARLLAATSRAGAVPDRPTAPPVRLSFEEQLERVRSGTARIADKIVIRRPDPTATLGGIGSALL